MKITLPGLVLLLFVTLKLCGVIHWSWWWVLIPLWIPYALHFLAKCLEWFAEWMLQRGETPEETKQRHAREKLSALFNETARRAGRR